MNATIMVRKLGLAVFSCLILSASAQNPADIVKWTAHLTRQTATAATIDLSADIQQGWHVYALSEPPGPIPLTVSIPKGEAFALNGAVLAPAPISQFDPPFGMETKFYVSHFQLTVPIKKSNRKAAVAIPINVEFQACSVDTCMPPYIAHLIADSAAK